MSFLFSRGNDYVKIKQHYIVWIVLVIVVFSAYLFYENTYKNEHSLVETSNTKEINSDEIIRETADTISYGIKSITGEHIDNGSKLNPENNKISVKISINHNIDEDREYGLIVLEDFKQVQFKIENKEEFTKYFFNMEPNSSKYINVSLPVNSKSRELNFLLVKKPNYKLKELDFNRAAILEEVLSMRYSINQTKHNDNVRETAPDTIIKDGLNENLFVTKNKKKLESVFVEEEGKVLTLSAGNDTDKVMKYAIVAFKDWDQSKIINNQEVIYMTVPSEVRGIFDFKLPDVEHESNFQFIALPFPYEVSKDNYISQESFESFRILIQNKD
jgi:hypothetical protein